MNKKYLLLNAIQEMLNGNIDETNAICENLDILTDFNITGYRSVKMFSQTWEHYSGEESYPVSGENVWDTINYDDPTLWWQGEQRELRFSLLEHIKSEVSKLSEEEFERVLNG